MTDETNMTTLAERLLELLEAGRSKGRQERAAGKVWAEILGVEHDSPEYLRLMADTNGMIADLAQLVADSGNTEAAKQNYGKTLREILNAFQRQTLAQHWKITREKYLTDEQIRDLQNLHSYLAHWHPIGRISHEKIEQLKAEIDHVREQLDNSGLPPELVKLLRSHVEAIRRILSHYNIYGSDRLYDASMRIMGELTLHHEILKKYGNDKAVRDYKGLMAKVVTVSTTVASAITIGGAAGGAVGWLLGP